MCDSVYPCSLCQIVLHNTVIMVSITMFCIFAPHREIDGEVYVGEVKEKEKAKKQYEKAVSSGQTAGLVK